MRRAPSLAAVVVAALLALAAPTGAARVELVRMPSHTPKLVAGGAVFFSPSTSGLRVIRVQPGQPAQTLTTLQHPPGAGGSVTVESDLRLAASDSHVAASRWVRVVTKGLEAEDSFRIEAGPAAGPLRTLHECRGRHPIDVDAAQLAHTNGCVEQGGTPPVMVRNLNTQQGLATAIVEQSARVTEVDLAGQHLAMLSAPGGNPQIAVRDYTQANDAYVVPAANIVQFSLQSDGKLAVKEQSQNTCRIAWYSKAEPFAHNIEVCPFGDVRLAGDRMVYEREEEAEATLELRSLTGQTQTVASFAAAGMMTGQDFDGSRVAYGVSGCVPRRDAVYVDDLAGPPGDAHSALCPVVISKAQVRASSSGIVKFGIACTEGCQGSVDLRHGGRRAVRDVKSVLLDSGSGKVSLRLTPAMREKLADRGSLLVQARVQAGQLNGIPRTFKRSIRLLRPR